MTNNEIFITKKTTKEEYEKYANSFDQYIHLDEKHKSEYIIHDNEIVRRIINGYGQWTPFGVSTKGNVYNIDNDMTKLPKYEYHFQSTDQEPYLCVHICIPMTSIFSKKKIVNCKTVGIHRLVMDAFIEHKDGYNIADHINENHLDNSIENIRRTTVSGNMHAFVKNRLKEDPYYFYKNKRPEELTRKIENICKMLSENKLPLWEIAEINNCTLLDIDHLFKNKSHKDLSDKYHIEKYTLLTEIDLDNMSDFLKEQIDYFLRKAYSPANIIFIFHILDEDKKVKKWIKERINILIYNGHIDGKYIYENEDTIGINKMIREGYRPSVIAEKYDHKNDYIYIRHITYLRQQIIDKEGFIEFNDELSEYEKDVNSLPRVKIKDVKIVNRICQMLEDNKLKIGEIAKIAGVSKHTVVSIKAGQTWALISANYNVSNHEINEGTHEFATREMKQKVLNLFERGYRALEICHKLGYHNEVSHKTHTQDRTPFYRYVSTLKSKYNKEKNIKRDE